MRSRFYYILSSLILNFIFIFSAPLKASEEKKITAGISGMLGLSYLGETSSLTFGGPQVAAQMGDFKVAVSFYPSLVRSDLFDYKTRPSLGFGLEVQYEKIVLFMPSYYLTDKYRTTIGLGYRF